jgi:hypothetical protein
MSCGIASIKISEITIGADDLIAVSVRDLSRMHQIGLQKTQKFYQSILTNALSHERMTPLNAIINGCESIKRRCYQDSKAEGDCLMKSVSMASFSVSKKRNPGSSMRRGELDGLPLSCSNLRKDLNIFQYSSPKVGLNGDLSE